MKSLLASLGIAIAFTLPALAATDAELKQALVGTWGDSAGCKDGILVFNADGTFTSGGADDPDNVQKGTYTIANGKLNGNAGDHPMPEVTVTLEGNKIVFLGAEEGQRQELVPCGK